MRLQTGRIVRGTDFTGRKELLKTVATYIDMNQSVVLIAPRRYGKSSIIRKILDTETAYKSIEIDIMKIYNKKDLAAAIIEETYKLVGISNIFEYMKKTTITTLQTLTSVLNGVSLTIDDVEIGLTFDLAAGKDDDALLLHALELPEKIAEKLNIRIIFAIDELGEIRNLKDHKKILALMRSVFQKNEKVNFIFAGSQYSLMNKIFTDKNSPFFRFAEIINVPTMKEEEFSAFLKHAFEKDHVSLYDTFTKDVVGVSGGIPYYIIKIAQEVLITAMITGKMNTYRINVCKAALKRYKAEESYFLGELSKIKGKKYYIQLLKALSNKEDPYKEMEKIGVIKQNINKILLSLLDDGLIEKEGKKYKITDPFLNRYIRKSL
jgi:hypothetical protein